MRLGYPALIKCQHHPVSYSGLMSERFINLLLNDGLCISLTSFGCLKLSREGSNLTCFTYEKLEDINPCLQLAFSS